MDPRSFLLFDMAFDETPMKASKLSLEIPALAFDRVYDGHLTASAFPVFRLPVELFPHILQYLTPKDLKTLSLVDRDCLRLAMPSRFKDVMIRLSPDKSCSLLASLPHSTTQHFAPSHPTLGMTSCVRRLAINPDPSGRSLPNYSTVVTEYPALPLENRDIPLSTLLQSICDAIESSLPNLHILDWDIPTIISSTVLRSLFASPAKHLRFEGTVLHDNACILDDNDDLLLESLSVNVSFPTLLQNAPPHRFFDNILRRSRGTLRQLRWTGDFDPEEIFLANDEYRFPCLRSLTLDTISRNSDNVIRLFLGPHTRVETLAMDTMSPSTSNFFRDREYIPSLKHLCWLIHDQGDAAPYNKVTNFISNNNQLEGLHIPGPVPPSFLSQSLLPTLSHHFNSLTSLHLVSAASDIHDEAFEALATINSLRHLWISAGNQNGIRNTWEINHESIITRLSRLTRLETLAFSRDTYQVNAHPLAPRFGDYYSTRALPVDLDVSKYLSPADFDIYQGKNVDFSQGMTQQVAMRRLAWESWHAGRMVAIGDRYGVALLSLRWLFIGQLVLISSQAGRFELALQPPQRDPCLSSLQKKMSMTLWRPV